MSTYLYKTNRQSSKQKYLQKEQKSKNQPFHLPSESRGKSAGVPSKASGDRVFWSEMFKENKYKQTEIWENACILCLQQMKMIGNLFADTTKTPKHPFPL